MATNPVNGSSTTPQPASAGSTDVMSAVKLDDFLKLMITELQNQDPLNPMDNGQILQQLGQMQSISSTTKLSQSLESVVLGQNLTSASGLIAKKVAGLDDSGKLVSGTVDRVLIESGVPKLMVGDSKISLTNLKQVLSNLVDALYVGNQNGGSGNTGTDGTGTGSNGTGNTDSTNSGGTT